MIANGINSTIAARASAISRACVSISVAALWWQTRSSVAMIPDSTPLLGSLLRDTWP